MKKQYIKDCFAGIIAGIAIYFVDMLVSQLAYLHISNGYFELIFFGLIILGVALSVFALLYKNLCITSMLVRFFALLISFCLTLAVIGSLELIPLLDQLLKLDVSSASDGVSGLMSLTFLIAVFSTCIITIVIVSVIKGLLYFKKNR